MEVPAHSVDGPILPSLLSVQYVGLEPTQEPAKLPRPPSWVTATYSTLSI